MEQPINPCGFALGAGARFIARAYDLAMGKLPDLLKRAHAHRGASFVEIYQNCIVYNDGAFQKFAGKKAGPEALLWLEAGKPMLFANGTKGLRLNRESMKLEVVAVADQTPAAAGVFVHDETNKSIAQLLVDMPFGDFPMALGVIYCDPTPAFDSAVVEQITKVSAGKKRDLNALLRRGDSWSVAGDTPAEID